MEGWDADRGLTGMQDEMGNGQVVELWGGGEHTGSEKHYWNVIDFAKLLAKGESL